MQANQVQRNSFLIRIWREPGRVGWRGWIQHIPTGEATIIQDLAQLRAFLERFSGKLTQPPHKGLK